VFFRLIQHHGFRKTGVDETHGGTCFTFLLLSILLHALAGFWLTPTKQITVAEPPQAVHVVLVAAPPSKSAEQEAVVQPAQPAPSPQAASPPRKTFKPKPVPKKATKPKVLARKESTAATEENAAASSAPVSTSSTPHDDEPPGKRELAADNDKTDSPSTAKPDHVEHTVAASFHANYLHNPKPFYPAAARQRGWEGGVKLRVHVLETGFCDQVLIHSSSGYDSLDEAAIETVKKWRFVPAKRGETPIVSWVIVPITFRLDK
jgi:protein TonB